MEEQFWHERWEKNEIGFHQSDVNAHLIQYFDDLDLNDNGRIFVPLCGKTLDINWLLSKGHHVIGVELNEDAVQQLFQGLGIDPDIEMRSEFKIYSAEKIDIFVGNIFALTADHIGAINAVFDRAALVALPPDMRENYARHVIDITKRSPQLVISYKYDQALRAGPPFSIQNDEFQRLYEVDYDVSVLQADNITGTFGRGIEIIEEVRYMRP